jgi:outer membrane protein assembly factor BamB
MGDSLVVVSEEGEVYSIEVDTGVLMQTVSIGYSVMSTPFVQDDFVYIHARDDNVYAVDLQAGGITWKHKVETE